MTQETPENLLDELQQRVRWLLGAKFDESMLQINEEGWVNWASLAKKFSKQNEASDNDLEPILQAYNRLGSDKQLFESIIEDNSTLKKLEFLLSLALPIVLKENNQVMEVTGQHQTISKTAMSYLITLVAYICTKKPEAQDNLDVFVKAFISLVPKPSLSQNEPAGSSDTIQTEKSSNSSVSITAVNAEKGTDNAPKPDQRVKPSASDTTQQPTREQVSLILVFASKHLSALQAFTKNPKNKDAFPECAALLKQYGWFWYGRTTQSPQVVQSWSPISPNLCWLRLDMKEPGNPAIRPDPLKITDWLNILEQNRDFISSATTSEHGFNLETSDLFAKGFYKK